MNNKDFMRGFAVPIAELVRGFGEPSLAANLINQCGFTRADFKDVDAYDRKVILKLFSDERVLRKQAVPPAKEKP